MRKTAEGEPFTPNAEEALIFVNTLKAAMTVFDPTRLSDDHRAILNAVDDEFHSLVSGIRSLPMS
jgi:hypothetical protein